MSSNPSEFGKYRLIAELGHGGMADVFLAVQQGPAGFSKLVVLKKLRASLADDPEFIAMLLDEARIAARLNHPNVVQTNEIGNVGNEYFIAMEYLDGQPLHRISQRAGTSLSRHHYYSILCDVLEGLRHAHTLQDFDGSPLHIVHRDITPQNVFVTYDGGVKIVDFGIAKAVGRASVETRQGVIKGKVRYMSYEQARGHNVDARADVFAVGVMLWEAATGQRLWRGFEDMQVLAKLMAQEIPASPREVSPEVPEEIDQICRRALAPLNERYQSAEEMRLELDGYLSNSGQRPSAREVGDAIAVVFDDKRVEVKQVIEQKLAELKSLPDKDFEMYVMQATQSQSRPRLDTLADDDPRGQTAMTNVTSSRMAPTGVSPKVIVSVVVSALAVAAAGFVVQRTRQSKEPPPVAAISPSAPVAKAALTNTAPPATPPPPTATAATPPATADDAGAPVATAVTPKKHVATPIVTAVSPTTTSTKVKPPRVEDDGLSTRK